MAEVYRGEFNHTLSNPLLLFGETYDPATPLRNGRRLAKALGEQNAKLGENLSSDLSDPFKFHP